jgi:hypothetical protein
MIGPADNFDSGSFADTAGVLPGTLLERDTALKPGILSRVIGLYRSGVLSRIAIPIPNLAQVTQR